MSTPRYDLHGRVYSASISDTKLAQIQAELAMSPLERVELALALGDTAKLIAAARPKSR